MRACTQCGQEKPLDAFHYRKEGRHGRRSVCRECITAQQAEKYRADPSIKRQQEAWRRANPDKRRAAEKRWREKNPEKEREARARWWAENREKRREYNARAYWKDLAKSRAAGRQATQTRSARMRGQFIEDVDPAVVYQMHGGRCGICSEFIAGDFHVDHVIPLSRGGKHGYVNAQPAHPLCNQRKWNHLQEEMAA